VNTLLPTFTHTRAREYHSSRLVSTCVSIQWLGMLVGPMGILMHTYTSPCGILCNTRANMAACG